ncbi:MAG TPA: MATE family efflux transporter [Trueperaceae bacterium]|nr:MATE family efflux transporter [Trueperaceae bacterium]
MAAWRRELRDLSLLAAPLVLAQLAQNGMSVVDTLMVGRLGPQQLAGIALGGTLFTLMLIVCMGVLYAVGPMVAHAHGGSRPEEAARATRQGFWLALALSVPGVVVFVLARPLLLLTGQEPAVAAASGGYLRAMAWGFPFALVLTALRGFLEGHGDTRPILLVAALGVALNVFANDVLMFGRLGFPRLGLVGTGYATAVVYAVMASLVAAYLRWRYPRYRLFAGLRRPDPAMLRELFRVGWPISLTLGFEVGLFALTALLMGRFGDAALAGHQIALQSASTTFMVPLGVSIATGVRVGQAAGRGEQAGVARSGFTGIALSVLFMAFAGALFKLAPDVVIGLYLPVDAPANAAVVAYARRFLAIAAIFQVFDGTQVTASGALRGLKDTRAPMLLTLVAYWLVAVPVGVVLAFPAGFGPAGLWFGLVVGLATAAVLLVGRLALQVRWRRRAPGLPAAGLR